MKTWCSAENRTKEQIVELIAYGRKTIATIVDIQYISADAQYLKKVEAQSNNKSAPKPKNIDNKAVRFILRCPPVVKVKYKFNPPDDLRSEDLVHELIMHHEPEKYLKIGDPLPILYRV